MDVQLSYELTDELAARSFDAWLERSQQRVRFMPLAVVLFLLLAVLGFALKSYVVASLCVAVTPFLVFFGSLAGRARKTFLNEIHVLLGDDRRITVFIDDAGVHSVSCRGSGSWNWRMFRNLIRADRQWLLILPGMQFVILPGDGLNPDTRSFIENRLRSAGVPVDGLSALLGVAVPVPAGCLRRDRRAGEPGRSPFLPAGRIVEMSYDLTPRLLDRSLRCIFHQDGSGFWSTPLFAVLLVFLACAAFMSGADVVAAALGVFAVACLFVGVRNLLLRTRSLRVLRPVFGTARVRVAFAGRMLTLTTAPGVMECPLDNVTEVRRCRDVWLVVVGAAGFIPLPAEAVTEDLRGLLASVCPPAA
ncbi:MAG: YcxB family protein [Planctomycetes bacterium]|nr:YcxB family protein [Planctomycetota bacterium]